MSKIRPSLQVLIQSQFSAKRKLDHGNPNVQAWTETWGEIRCLIEEKDNAAAEVHLVKIQDAKLHYHEKTDEIY